MVNLFQEWFSPSFSMILGHNSRSTMHRVCCMQFTELGNSQGSQVLDKLYFLAYLEAFITYFQFPKVFTFKYHMHTKR